MLKALHVKNLALIEEADISFDKGFTVFSGETGAGKSILLESIHMALGGRAPKDLIRTGKEYALVELTFVVDDEMVLNVLGDKGVWPEDSEIVISRKLTNDKSLIRVNGETVSAAFVREIGDLLLDIHGQNEHHSLLKKSNQMNILDAYGKEDIAELKEIIKNKYNEYKRVLKNLNETDLDETSRIRELDYIEFEINEIESASLKEGEEDELSNEYSRLSNARNIMEIMGKAMDMVGGSSGRSAEDLIGEASGKVSAITDLDSGIKDIYDQLLVLESEVSDCSRAISNYLNSFSFDEETLRNTAERLDLIRNLEKKYGATIQQINEHLEKSKERRDELICMAETRERSIKAKAKLEDELKSLSHELTKKRIAIKTRLEEKIMDNLRELNFLHVYFEAALRPLEGYTANGMDEVEFMISMNKGESPKPLELVASGGELSRIMLAIKTVLADSDVIETQIFDEIDAGISGITASCVAKKLREIGNKRQVFCISHLPQIVSAANNHYLIEKKIVDDKTITTVESLDEAGSIREIARILGGDMITETTLSSAAEMKKMY